MKGISIRASFTITSLMFLFAFSCVAYLVHADNLSPQQRFAQLETAAALGSRPTVPDRALPFSSGHLTGSTTRPSHVATDTAPFETNVASRTAAIKARLSDHRAALSAKLQQRITDLAANVSNRLDAVTARLTQISGRFASRISKLQAQGVDTTAAQQQVDLANQHINNAKTALATIDTTIAGVTSSSTPKEAWAAARAKYTSIRTELMAAHQALMTALSDIQTVIQTSALDQTNTHATSTASN